MDYKGRSCPVCSEKFREEDDIVVCPKCGAPYHRECYKQNNKCIFAERHKSGKSWQEAEEEKQAKDSGSKLVRCPHCNSINPENAIVCKICGGFISDSVETKDNTGNSDDEKSNSVTGTVRDNYQSQDSAEDNTDSKNQMPFPPGGVPLSVFLDPMGGVPKDEDFDGVTGAEISKYVKANTSYYLPVFYRMKTQSKNKFSFCAFLFTGAWYLYRKMYVKGAIISLLYILVEIASLVLSNAYSTPLIKEANQYFENSYYVNFFDYFSWAFNNKSFGEAILMFAPYFLLALFLIVRVLCGLRANKSYFRHCIKKVKTVKAVPLNPGEENHNKALSEAGGVNTAIAWMCLACYVILYIASVFI